MYIIANVLEIATESETKTEALTMCALKAAYQWTCHHGESEISEIHSSPPGQRILAREPYSYP